MGDGDGMASRTRRMKGRVGTHNFFGGDILQPFVIIVASTVVF